MKTIIKGKNVKDLKANPREAIVCGHSCDPVRDLPCSGNKR